MRNKEFKVNTLNDLGAQRAKFIANAFDDLLDDIKLVCPDAREFAICKSKLEEACFYAKKAMCSKGENLADT